MITSALSMARDVVSDCTIDALVSTIEWIENDSLSTKPFFSKDGLDSKYHNIISSPHQYFLDTYNLYPHIGTDEKTIGIDNLANKLNSNSIEKLNIYFNGELFGKAVKKIKSGYAIDSGLIVDSLYEVLYIQNQSLYGNLLSVVVGYCILDNNFQIRRLPLQVGYVYALDKKGTWKKLNGHWVESRQPYNTSGCGTEMTAATISYDGDLSEHSMAWVKKFVRKISNHREMLHRNVDMPDVFDIIKPYTYYRYQTTLLKNNDKSGTDAHAQPRFLCAEANNTCILDDRTKANREIESEYFVEGNKPVVLKKLDVDTLSDDADIFCDYEIVADSAKISNMKKLMTNSNANEIRYVLTPAQINLSGDTITVEIKLFEITEYSDSKAGIEYDKNDFRTMMLLVSKQQYKAFFRYHRKRWIFMQDKIENTLNDKQILLLM